jgi:hypothetical protein
MLALAVRGPPNHWQCPALPAAVSREASRILYGYVPIGTIGHSRRRAGRCRDDPHFVL